MSEQTATLSRRKKSFNLISGDLFSQNNSNQHFQNFGINQNYTSFSTLPKNFNNNTTAYSQFNVQNHSKKFKFNDNNSEIAIGEFSTNSKFIMSNNGVQGKFGNQNGFPKVNIGNRSQNNQNNNIHGIDGVWKGFCCLIIGES